MGRKGAGGVTERVATRRWRRLLVIAWLAGASGLPAVCQALAVPGPTEADPARLEAEVTRVPGALEGAGDAGPGGLFHQTSALEIAIEAPWKTLLRQRRSRPAVEGTLIYAEATGSTVEVPVTIKARGKWRLENCSSPPLTLTLEGERIDSTLFAGQGVLHLSTPCFDGEKYEQHLFQEYLIYRIYALLTEVSLRSRLVTIEYRDTDGRRPPRRASGFLVEDLGLAAERLGRRWLDVPSVELGALEPGSVALFTLFQYMIGHTDWAVLGGPPGERCCHNAALLAGPGPPTGIVPVPYDFDASGFVNTGDVLPSEHLPIDSVRERYYRGFCDLNSHLPGAIEVMNRARPEIESLLDEGDLLKPTPRRGTLRYLETFYETINSPAQTEARILRLCRGDPPD